MRGQEAHALARVEQFLQPGLRATRTDALAQAGEGQPLRLTRDDAVQHRRVGATQVRQQRGAHAVEQATDQLGLRAFTLRQGHEHRATIPDGGRLEHLEVPGAGLVEAGAVREGRCLPGPHLRDELIGERQRIAHAATGTPRDLAGHAGLAGDAFGGQHLVESPGDDVLGQRRQLEHLAARQDRVEHLVRFRCREEELHVRRRLLQRLQQRVERRLREHVHLVDEVHLEARAQRHVPGLVAQRTHLIDAVVRSTVDLDQIDLGPLVGRQATLADATRIGHGPGLAVESLREDPRGRRLPRTARSGEQIGVSHSPGRDGPSKRALHPFLTDDLGKGARPILPREHQIAHAPILQPPTTNPPTGSPQTRSPSPGATERTPGPLHTVWTPIYPERSAHPVPASRQQLLESKRLRTAELDSSRSA